MAVRRRALMMTALAVAATVAGVVETTPTEAGGVTLASSPIDNTNCYYANTWMAPRSASRRHEGVDIIAKAGTNLYAVQAGKIVRSQGSLAGNQVKVVAPDGTYFIYAHLSAYADTAPHGASVAAGTLIGYVGKTGNTSVNHLHFEIHPTGGKAVDPTAIVAAVNTCGSKVAQKAVSTPSPWANVTTTTTPKSTVPKTTTPATTLPTTVAPTTTVVPTTTPTTIATTVPTTVAPTTPPSGDTTTTAPSTTAAPTTAPATTTAPTPGSKTFSKPVVVQKINGLAANKTTGIKVVGFPGIPKGAKSVTLAITMTGKGEGRAAIWPCGQKAGLDTGTPLTALTAGTAVSSTVTLAPGEGGRVCLVASVGSSVNVSVAAYA